MQEDNSIQFQEQLDQMLHNARLRRSADLGDWLKLIGDFKVPAAFLFSWSDFEPLVHRRRKHTAIGT